MGYIIGYRPAGGIGGVVAAGLLVIVCAWAISWIFACLGLIARTAGSVQGLALLILFPLTFLSNAYVGVATLPDWMQAFVKVNPITHIITAVRSLTNDGTWSIDGWWALLGAAIIVAIFAPITVRLYMRKA